MLTDLVAQYLDAKKIWEAQFDEDCQNAAISPEWRRYMDLSYAIIDFRCSTLPDIQQKADFVLRDSNLIDMCASESGVMALLKSIEGQPVENGAVNNADNGEN